LLNQQRQGYTMSFIYKLLGQQISRGNVPDARSAHTTHASNLSPLSGRSGACCCSSYTFNMQSVSLLQPYKENKRQEYKGWARKHNHNAQKWDSYLK